MSSPALPCPKVVLFDIGGVCVVSPFQAILDYEIANGIPPGWVNFSISRSSPNGAWQRLERGEIANDPNFFREFNADLRREELWREHCAKAARKAAGTSSSTPLTTPPLPNIDAEWLFWEMMRVSREPDPHMFPAVQRLATSDTVLVAALSNTSIFPPGHPYNDPPADPSQNVRAVFDVFVSSAHVGLRKPDARIYELAMSMLNERWKALGNEGQLSPGDVLFLDDIGENLRQARKLGMRTIKVHLGDTRSAVKELERAVGFSLSEDKAKI